MYYVYVLKSVRTGWLYRGLARDLRKRVLEHNIGKVKSTRFRRPYTVIYFEGPMTLAEARSREKYFKTSAGRRKLKALLSPGEGFPARTTA